MRLHISVAADTVDTATRLEKREAAAKKRAILDNMKDMLSKLREQFQKASDQAKNSIRTKMELIKKRFNQIYSQLHNGEEYYSVANVTYVVKEESLSDVSPKVAVQQFASDFMEYMKSNPSEQQAFAKAWSNADNRRLKVIIAEFLDGFDADSNGALDSKGRP